MAPAGAALEDYFRTISFAQPEIPVVFNCTGTIQPEGISIPALLVRQVQSSVFMEDSLRALAVLGVDAMVEIGPGRALSGFLKKTLPGFPVCSVETADEVEHLMEKLKAMIPS